MRRPSSVPRGPNKVSLDDEIARLRDLDLHGLRARWQSMLRHQPPSHLPRHLLFAVLAYRLQADELGDLDPTTARLLRQIAAAGGGTLEASQLTEVFGRRRTELKLGTILLREWNAQAYRVMVVDEGFSFNGKRPMTACPKWLSPSPVPIGAVRGSLVCGTRSSHDGGRSKIGPLRHLYARVDRVRPRAGFQLARCAV